MEFEKFDIDFSALMSSKNPEQPEKKEGLIFHLSAAIRIIKKRLKKTSKKLTFNTDDVKIARSISSKTLIIWSYALTHKQQFSKTEV